MSGGSDGGRHFVRNRFANGCLFAICAFAAIAFLEIGIEAINGGSGTVLVAFDFVLCTIFSVPAVRSLVYGVVITGTQLKIRNIMRTHVLRWDEVERFELARYDPWPRVGVAVLKSGRRVPMVGVQWAPLSRFAEKTVAGLNERLAEAG